VSGAVYLIAYVVTWTVGLTLMLGSEWLMRRRDRRQ